MLHTIIIENVAQMLIEHLLCLPSTTLKYLTDYIKRLMLISNPHETRETFSKDDSK